MISSARAGKAPQQAYVWVWLPGRTDPVVAGQVARTERGLQFNYGRSYLERKEAIALYDPELPLRPGLLPLLPGLTMPNCLRDACPDAWGRRVILHNVTGRSQADPDELTELTYMLASGSERIGALDFQASPSEYIPRVQEQASLEHLLEAAELLEQGAALPSALELALLHGTSLGGARPKALLTDRETSYVAKFSSTNDVFPVVQAEFVAMRLARLVGLDAAPVELVRIADKDVLLVQRFDRHKTQAGWQRKMVVSALTLLELDELMARYASYEDLAEIIRFRFTQPQATLKELFARVIFNVLCGNTDDHARNHAAFWDGRQLRLTPAYDICPQNRSGNEASQAMLIQDRDRSSRLENCLAAARQFLLSQSEARAIIEQQIEGLHRHWDAVCDAAGLTVVERRRLWGRQFCNPFAMPPYEREVE